MYDATWLAGKPVRMAQPPLCVLPSHDADDASKIKHTVFSKKLASDRGTHNSTCQLTGAIISSKCIVIVGESVT